MRKLLTFLSVLFFITACDDGDVILVQLEFDDTFESCGDLVFFNIREEPVESISLQIGSPNISLEDLFETDVDPSNSLLVTLENPLVEGIVDGNNNLLNYRSYNTLTDNMFCNDVPPSNLGIIEDQYSNSGNFTINTELIEDDNDGIPAEMEDLNNNGDLFDDDTDGDGLPNFLDVDDDGDNVLTSTELIDYNLDDNDDDPLTDPEDTDGDGIPNYLDADDDNDLVLTIDEENLTQDENPANDFTNPNFADYLNDQVATTVAATAYRAHEISQTFNVNVLVEDVSFQTLNQDTFDFGLLEDSRTTKTRNVTPDF